MLGRFIVSVTFLAWCGAMGTECVPAQETINYASLGGRVTDPQGAVVQGAEVVARQAETNLTVQATTEEDGGGRLPYLKLSPNDETIKQPGFADANRRLTLTVGAAFELPISLNLGSVSENVTVSGQAPVLEAVRSQIASTVSQT